MKNRANLFLSTPSLPLSAPYPFPPISPALFAHFLASMLYYGRKGRLVNQPPLPEHKQTHDLLMHYENYPGELPPLPPLEAPWEEKARTHTSFQGTLSRCDFIFTLRKCPESS